MKCPRCKGRCSKVYVFYRENGVLKNNVLGYYCRICKRFTRRFHG